MNIKRQIAGHLRHIFGWRTYEKLIVLNVDDYGSIRLASRAARDVLRRRIPNLSGYMDNFDALETREDLAALFEVLERARGADGKPAVVTAYALSANPDFDTLRSEGRYVPEALPDTFARLEVEQKQAYEGTWALWQEGMHRELLHPQFHGREHFSLPLIEAKLAKNDDDLRANLEVDSMAGLRRLPAMPGVGFTHSFGLHDESLLPCQREVIKDGLDRFEKVFGFRSRTFTPPAQRLHPLLDDFVFRHGVRAIDKPFLTRRPTGKGKSRPMVSFLRAPTRERPGTIVRTLSFEPCSNARSDAIGHALRQIELAFRFRKPAIISSHRVNFAGHIDPSNRSRGLTALRALLAAITRRWPDARFITADQLVGTMEVAR